MGLIKAARCEISGLVSAYQHNGKHGSLLQFSEDIGRWKVLLDGGKVLAVKPENLHDLAVARVAEGMGLLAIETFNCKVRLVDVKTGQERITVRAQGKALGSCLKFSVTGELLACGGIESRCKIVDTRSGAQRKEIVDPREDPDYTTQIDAVGWSPCGERLAIAIRADEDIGVEVDIWNYSKKKWFKELNLVPDPDNAQTTCSQLSFSPDGAQLGVGFNNGRVHILDSRAGNILQRIGDVQGDAFVFAFSADWTRKP